MLSLLWIAPLAVLATGKLGGFSGKPPNNLGIHNGRLTPPSLTGNSVSSQAGLYPEHPQKALAAIEPLPWLGSDSAAAMRALQRALQAQPGIQIVEQTPDYVHAQARTPWLGFVDDLEFWANPASQVIELRSASRLGQSDLGTNRARIETIRAVYSAAAADASSAVD